MLTCSVCEQEFDIAQLRRTWNKGKPDLIYTCKPCFQDPKPITTKAKPKKPKKVKKDEPPVEALLVEE